MKDKMILKAAILKKLRRHGIWGEKHTAFDELLKGLPKHLRSEAKEVAEEMLKEGLLLPKSTSCGLHVSLNTKKKAEIDQIINEVLKE
jgi:hypothetical protein